MARTLEGQDVPFLSAAIRECRESFMEMYPEGVEVGRAGIEYANELLRTWESEARNMENRLVMAHGHHRPLADGEAFQAVPSELGRRIVPMTPAEIAARDAGRKVA